MDAPKSHDLNATRARTCVHDASMHACMHERARGGSRLCARARHRLRHVRLRVVCSPTQRSQPAESALSAERHTGVSKATSVLRGIYTLGHINNREIARSGPS